MFKVNFGIHSKVIVFFGSLLITFTSRSVFEAAVKVTKIGFSVIKDKRQIKLIFSKSLTFLF
jgi:hypothetical protein